MVRGRALQNAESSVKISTLNAPDLSSVAKVLKGPQGEYLLNGDRPNNLSGSGGGSLHRKQCTTTILHSEGFLYPLPTSTFTHTPQATLTLPLFTALWNCND